jgi:uncharacterized damage-inducible protein DinB
MAEKTITARRAELHARLAAERANVFYVLRGLDEETLCTTPVSDGWTVRDKLPHLGYWDAFYADRIQRLVDGRRLEIDLPADDAARDDLNATARHMFSHMNWGQAVAVAVKERNGLLATLARTPDDVFFGRFYLGQGRRASPATWARARYAHDAGHAAQIAQWRDTLPPHTAAPKPPASKVILRPFLAASRRELMALAGLIAADERHTRPVCGPWTLRDVLSHLTGYEFMAVTALRDLSAGRTPYFEKTIRNFDAFNEAQALARRDVAWPQTLDDYRAVRKALVTLVDTLSDAELTQPFTAPWGSPITGYQYVFGLAIHEQEHAAILRRALRLPALPRRLRHYRAA